MKYLLQLTIFLLLSILFSVGAFAVTYNNTDNSSYTTLRSIDLGTYNEYRYRLTEQFFKLRETFEINKELDRATLQNIAILANTGYRYLPDNLQNKNILQELLIDIQKGIKTPENQILYTEIITSLADYLENVEIEGINGQLTATPQTGNAPLTVTFRGAVQDPSGTQILTGNYTWWVDSAGKKVVIGRGPSVNFTFQEEGVYAVFLDVTSSHKNKEGYTDVLPYRSRVDVTVKEKIASVIINIDGDKVEDNEVLKFTPDDAAYGLLFDASSSTPEGGATFVKTLWDFGNGATRVYNGPPKIERVRYGTEGDYNVTLRLETNEGKVVERTFALMIRDPIAQITSNREDGFIGDSFTFSAKSSGLERDLTYSWEVIDIENDTIITQKADKVLTHVFTKKGKYNIRLKVRQSSGEIDQDNYIVYVTSQAPIAEFSSTIPLKNKPNRILLDASRSHDPDFMDDGNLKYDWFIDGERARLEDANSKGSVGYYEFDSIGSHSVNLEVTDPDGMVDIKKGSVVINSLLSVEMEANPRVIQRGNFIRFVADAPKAEVYEWDFGDGKSSGGDFNTITHTYDRSGDFVVRLRVTDADNNTNTYSQTVYVSESNTPLAYADITFGSSEIPVFDEQACNGQGAYVVDRVNSLRFNAQESINIDGSHTGLEYSWKIGHGKFADSVSVSHKFDEIGCFPVKLTVKSSSNGKTDAVGAMVDVRNLTPTLTSLAIDVEDTDVDPLIIRVSALGASDPDGVIQSYLWYYYTDIDSEPQDFRATATDSTAFVIPKITGTYYFVAILKDNNEARVTSEEVTGSRFFQTITGDNINTPIVDLSVNDNSTIIGEEITFTAKAQNILGQSVEKDASYSWDFDGDGFYDTQTSEPTTTYAYRKSGEFYAKVKVKYRGISSTKNVTMNVSNKLVPKFGYISVGNTFMFFDNSTGQIDSRQWDLGDGTTKTGTNFSHTYTDKATTHTVTLRITEGTTVKEVQKKVTKNIKNILNAKRKDFVGFSFPEADETGTISIDSPSEQVFIYMGEGAADGMSFAIDYDIEHDSDLNGGMDDDEDNAGTPSYNSGDLVSIPLNEFRIQKIRLFRKSETGTVIASQDITIQKEYIEETKIDPNTIVFEGVTEGEKEKIEKLKSILSSLPQNQRLEALSYVQKLQENWNDGTEKTRTILDFEDYIFGLGLSEEDEIIDLLESLLVEGQEDQSAEQITYMALVNLIPQDINCEVTTGSCYDSMLSKLEDIRSSDDIEYNKALGSEVLEVVGSTDTMTNQQKLDFKAILASLVYGGDIDNIPEEEKNEVIAEEIPVEENNDGGGISSGILSVLLTVLKWLAIIIGIFIIIVAIFYILYLIFNRDSSVSFSQFISKITGGGEKTGASKGEEIDDTTDILAEFGDDSNDIQTEVTSDILSTVEADKEVSPKEANIQVTAPISEAGKQDESLSSLSKEEDVPDWLKGNFSPEVDTSPVSETPKPEVTPNVEKPEKKRDIENNMGNESTPDWLQQAPQNPKDQTIVKKATTENIVDEAPSSFDLEKDTAIDESNIPDWLKGAADFSEKPAEKTPSDTQTPLVVEKKGNIPSNPHAAEAKKDTSDDIIQKNELSDENVPDWLKGAADFSEKPAEKTPSDTQASLVEEKGDTPSNSQAVEKKKDVPGELTQKNELSDENVPDWLKGSFDAPKTEEIPIAKKDTPKNSQKQQNFEKDGIKKDPKKNTERKKTKNAEQRVKEKSKTSEVSQKNIGEISKKGSENIKSQSKKTPKDSEKKSKASKEDELWDDGMKIPNWLKTDD